MGFKFSKQNILFSAAVILTVFFQDDVVKFIIRNLFNRDKFNLLPADLRIFIIQACGLALCCLVVFFLSRFSIKKSISMLGFDKGYLRPLVFATISCSPMLIGCAILHGYQPDGTLRNVLLNSIWPGFNEEIIFRLFLAGMLVRYANWNIISAALLSGFLFAKGHLYQAHDFMEGVKIFFIVSGFGFGFAALCWMWDWNIWFTIFMHTFMNMAYVLFIDHGNVLLNPVDNILRGITIFMAIAFTIFYRVMSFRKNPRIES